MKKKLKKILIVFILIIFILFFAFIIFREIKIPFFLADEYYIINFEDINKTLTKEDENTLISFLNSDIYTVKESDNIKITKMACQSPFRHESSCYIFLKSSINSKLPFTLINITENYKEYVSEHICMNTNTCKEFNLVKKIVANNYKWWENNEKNINYTKIEEPYQTEITDTSLLENYEVVSGENLLGEIIDITDKYLKIQKDNNDIKLIKIDWKSTNFVNYRTKEALTIYGIKIGDYFWNKQIIRNITGEELIKESLKNIVDTSNTILFVPTKIISIKDMNKYYIVKIEMEDSTSEYFGKTMENRDKYEIDFIINNDTKFYPQRANITVAELQKLCENYITTIFISEKSINDEYPIITKVEVYDI